MLRKIILNIALILITLSTMGFSQSFRKLVNKGVDLYKEGKPSDAEVNFKKGLEKEPKNYIANFNLGDAYFKQQQYDEAIKAYQKALAESKTNEQKAQVYHNIGNSLLKDKKIDQSIGAYKQALKLNPDDHDTKYNLSYALSQMNNKNNNKDQNKNNKDKEKNNKDQQNKDQNKNNKQDQKKNQQNHNKQNQNQQQSPQQNKISKADAERILAALKNNEQELQKKLRKHTGKVIKTDKDW
jgi:Ca-activated chloride channel family protein